MSFAWYSIKKKENKFFVFFNNKKDVHWQIAGYETE
jgi:hypothetical protein